MIRINRNKTDGNNNNTTQIDTQNIYYQQIASESKKYTPDERAIRLLKETIEDEANNTIIYLKTLNGRTIQCGNGRFTLNSLALGEKEMTYWEDSLEKLNMYQFIGDIGNKGEVFKILKKGYEYYDSNIRDNNKKNKDFKFELNELHIKILKILRENDYSIWDSQLTSFFKKNIDNEIAFNELIDNGYIDSGLVFSGDDGRCYHLNSSKKMEVLKLLKDVKSYDFSDLD